MGEEGFDVVVEKEGRKKFLEGEGRATVGRRERLAETSTDSSFSVFPCLRPRGEKCFSAALPPPHPLLGNNFRLGLGGKKVQKV